MPGKTKLALVAAVAATLIGCGVLGYNPEDPVTVKVQADPALNTYAGAPHALDLYIFKVNDPHAFESTELAKLKAESASVPGGLGMNRQNVTPGEKTKLRLGPMVYEMYTHLGIVAAYREPTGIQKITAEIPSSGEFRLVLGPNGIVSLTEAD